VKKERVSQRITSLVFCGPQGLSFLSGVLHPGEERKAEAKMGPSQRKSVYFSPAFPELRLALAAAWLVLQNQKCMQG